MKKHFSSHKVTSAFCLILSLFIYNHEAVTHLYEFYHCRVSCLYMGRGKGRGQDDWQLQSMLTTALWNDGLKRGTASSGISFSLPTQRPSLFWTPDESWLTVVIRFVLITILTHLIQPSQHEDTTQTHGFIYVPPPEKNQLKNLSVHN